MFFVVLFILSYSKNLLVVSRQAIDIYTIKQITRINNMDKKQHNLSVLKQNEKLFEQFKNEMKTSTIKVGFPQWLKNNFNIKTKKVGKKFGTNA